MNFREKIALWAFPQIFKESFNLKKEVFTLKQELETVKENLTVEIKAQLAETNKIKWRERLVFIFEKEGHQYSRFESAVNMPLSRFEALQLLLINEGHRLSPANMDILLQIIEQSLERAFNETSRDGKMRINHMKTALFAAKELVHRREMNVFSPDFHCELFATLVIREDEQTEIIDRQIHEEKKAAFRTWGSEVDFFTLAGTDTLIEHFERLRPEWQRLWVSHLEQEERQNTTYRKILDEIT